MAALNGYLALGTINGAGVFTEITGATGYARQAVSFESVGSGKAQNSNAIAFTKARNSFWPKFNAIALYSGLSGGTPAQVWPGREPYPDELYGPQPMAVPARGLEVPLEFVTAGPSGARALVDILGSAQHPGLYNFKPGNLRKWRKALANVRAGLGNAKLAFPGDSTTAGEGASTGTRGLTNARAKSFPSFVAAILNGSGVPAQSHSIWGNGGGGMLTTGYDARLSVGAGWAEAAGTALGARLIVNSTTTNAFAFTPTDQIDTIDVWYCTISGGGTFTVDVDGGAALATQSTTGASGLAKLTVSTTLGAHTVNIKRTTGGGTYLLGIECYNSAIKAVSVQNMGWAGSKVSNWTTGVQAWEGYNALAILAPDLTVINLGVNDWDAVTPVASFKTDYQKLIDKAKLSGDVVLLIPAPSATSAATDAEQAAIIAAIYDLATANDLPVIDLTQRLVSHADANALGFYFDTLHPSGLGYADIAQLVARALMI